MRCCSGSIIHSKETALPSRRFSPSITCRFCRRPLQRPENGSQFLLTTLQERFVMSRNRGVVYTKPGEVQVQDIADPKFEDPRGHKIEHGVILKVVSTNICGS